MSGLEGAGPHVVLVVGPGRSGTSSMAGALALSGFEVPQAIKGNESNPLGFFEPRWVVNLHKRLLETAEVGTLDPDPGAITVMRRVTSRPKNVAAVRDWLGPILQRHDRVVIKDPRLVWFHDLWVAVSRDLGAEVGSVMMLRHPAEVSASRSTYYEATEGVAVAGWTNVALLTEELTRAVPRTVVRYDDLLADWRPQLSRVRGHLGLRLDEPAEGAAHPVDEFIRPELRRMDPDWSKVTVPDHVRVLAERVHDVLCRVAADDDSEVKDELADLRAAYDTVHQDARAMAASVQRRARARAVRQALKEAAVGGRAGPAEAGTTERPAEPEDGGAE